MDTSLKSRLARNLRAFRLSAGMTQSDLARKAGTLQPRVAVMESAEDPTLPRLEWLARAAQALGVSVSSLLSEEPAAVERRLSSLPEAADNLAAHLKGLGAPLTGHARKNRSFSPEAVVLGVLRMVPSSRMVECLPGLLARQPMDYEKLLMLAKERGLVNRLGFVADVAAVLAKHETEQARVSELHALSRRLWRERDKKAEQFLMQEVPEDSQFRNWLKKKTPGPGKKWGVYGAYSLERFHEAFRRTA